MAFSSSHAGNSNVRRGIGGGWTRSLLPFTSSTTKSGKHIRKSRKRAAVKDFLFANFFTIGLAVSIFFFFFVVYLYGVPKPISSQFRIGNSRAFRVRKPVYRKSKSSSSGHVSSNHSNLSLGAASVDLTTKDLYDKIEFKDEDGGPWTQGWRVSYKGDEWNNEKLKVFVVPHSHNDPGWKLTVDEYYDRQSRHILDTIIETLSKVRTKFHC